MSTPLEVLINKDYFDWPSFIYLKLNLIQVIVIVQLLTGSTLLDTGVYKVIRRAF